MRLYNLVNSPLAALTRSEVYKLSIVVSGTSVKDSLQEITLFKRILRFIPEALALRIPSIFALLISSTLGCMLSVDSSIISLALLVMTSDLAWVAKEVYDMSPTFSVRSEIIGTHHYFVYDAKLNTIDLSCNFKSVFQYT